MILSVLPVRKRLRLEGYDYSSSGCYFITICAKNREPIFGKITDNVLLLSNYGKIAEEELLKIPSHYDNVEIDKHIIMPNHVHAIITVGAPLAAPAQSSNTPEPSTLAPTQKTNHKSPPPTISNIVRGYKSGVSKIAGFPCWQRGYHDHIIRSEMAYLRIWHYIDENHLYWLDDYYCI